MRRLRRVKYHIFRFGLDPDICTLDRSVTGLDLDMCAVRGIFRFGLDPDICTVHRSVTGLDLDMSTVCSAWGVVFSGLVWILTSVRCIGQSLGWILT